MLCLVVKRSKMNKKKKTKKSLFSRINAWLHLWLGIFSGLILVFVALTGTLVVYGDEIIDWSAGKARYVSEVQERRVPMEQLIQNVHLAHPEAKLSEVTVYKDPKRSIRFRTFSKQAGLAFIYTDPYNGEVLKFDNTGNFFFVMAHLHASLLWHGPGEWIVDIATIIFLVELISGIILWWPKKWTKKTRDDSFKIRWKAKFKRVNYDLHNVLGFYSSLLAIILTGTGLIIAFKPVMDTTVNTFGGEASSNWQQEIAQVDTTAKAISIDHAFNKAFQANAKQTQAQLWVYNLDQLGFYMITSATNLGLKSAENAQLNFYNKYSGEALQPPVKMLQGEYVENYVWQLHMGTWLGPLGKLFTFICGLICTSLPITGFLIWWHKGHKSSQKRKQRTPEAPATTSGLP